MAPLRLTYPTQYLVPLQIYARSLILKKQARSMPWPWFSTLDQGYASLAFAWGLIYHLAMREWIRFQNVGMPTINAISAVHSAQSSEKYAVSRQPHESSAQPQG
jgi:hypothetical protein